MTRRARELPTIGLLLAAGGATLTLLACEPAPVESVASPTASEPRVRDVVLITVDTLRADRVGAYGHAQARTPTFDRLAAEGVRFERALTPIPRTTPGLGSLMTGLWPHHHGSREVRQPVQHGTTLAEVLRGHGFATIGVTASRTGGRPARLDRGFERFFGPGQLRKQERPTATDVTDQAVKQLRSVAAEGRVFLWLHYLDPHWPYTPPRRAFFDAEPLCDALRRRSKVDQTSNRSGRSARALAECLRAYDKEVAFVDREVERLLRNFDARRGLDAALIVLTSDHGENFGEAGLFYEHGPNAHDASLRVPLIVKGPGVAQGAVVATLVQLQDVAPTLLALAGVAPEEWPEMDGAGFAARLAQPSGQVEPPAPAIGFAESAGAMFPGYPHNLLAGHPKHGFCIHEGSFALCWKGQQEPTLHDRVADPLREIDVSAAHPELRARLLAARSRWTPGLARERCAHDGRFKLVERPRLEGGYRRALYDLAADPGEELDVSERHPRVLEQLGAALDEWTAGVPSFVPQPLDDADERALRSLGYLE